MAVHEHFVRLAATAVTDELSPRDAFSIANHVESCPDCRAAETELIAEHLRLRALVDARPVSAAMRAAVLDAVQERRAISPWRLLLVAGLLLVGLVGAAIFAGRASQVVVPDEFWGTWTTTNCATFWEYREPPLVDCDRWGDAATLRLEISAGGRTVLGVAGVGGGDCIGAASDESTLEPPQPGSGTFLLIRFDRTSCELIGTGEDRRIDVYRDEGQDELWIDDDGDGWGHKWSRST